MKRWRDFRMTLAAALGLIVFVAAGNASAGVITVEPQPGALGDAQSPSELAREGVAKMLEAFDKFVASVPRYELPQINENGDIILRRKQPEPPPAKAPAGVPAPAVGRAI